MQPLCSVMYCCYNAEEEHNCGHRCRYCIAAGNTCRMPQCKGRMKITPYYIVVEVTNDLPTFETGKAALSNAISRAEDNGGRKFAVMKLCTAVKTAGIIYEDAD